MRLAKTWSIHIDADGHVSRLQPITQIAPDLASALEAEIRQWRFQPGSVNGKPVDTDTFLHLNLAVRDTAAGSGRITFEEVSTGGAVDKRAKPSYPSKAISSKDQGLVVLQVTYDEQGHVEDAVPAPGMVQGHQSLVDGASEEVKRWTFKPEVVGGHALAGKALVPFCYSVVPSGSTPRPCSWKNGNPAIERGQNETVALDSVAQLITDIHDHTL